MNGKLNMPLKKNMSLFIHERQAHIYNDLIFIFKKFMNPNGFKTIPVVIHCFTGNYNELNTHLKHGFYIGITSLNFFSFLFFDSLTFFVIFLFVNVFFNCEISGLKKCESGNKISSFEMYILKEVNCRIM